jgi:PAS domain S-box-containing protein
MKWQANSYALPPFAIAFVLLGISFVAWRRRPGNGERHFILVMLVMALWLAGYGLELSSVDFSTLFFWVRVEYFGITTLPALWLIFVLVYAGPARWLNPARRVFLFVMPLITLALVWTNDYHHLIWATTGLDMSGPFPAFARTHGPWFWVHTAYSYLCLAGALVLMVRATISSPPLYRGQIRFLLLSMLVPWVGNILDLSGLRLVPHFELTPLSFGFACLFIAWSLFWFRLFDVVPAARDWMVHSLEDPVFIADRQGRIVDLNPAAQKEFALSAAEAIGQPVENVMREYLGLNGASPSLSEIPGEISRGEGADTRTFEFRGEPVYSHHHRLMGQVMVLHDITAHKRAQEALHQRRRTFHMLIGAMPNLLYVVDVQDHVSALFVPPRFLPIVNSADTAVGNALSAAMPASFFEPVAAALVSVRKTGQPGRLEHRLELADGRLVYLDVRLAPIPDSSDVLIVIDDITERKRAEEALRDSLQRERELGELKARFVSMASHEFRTPLTTILSSSDLIRKYYHRMDEADILESLDTIQDQVQHMAAMLNDMLTVGQGESGQIAFQPESVDVVRLCQQIVGEVEAACQKPHPIECAYRCTVPSFVVDKKLVRQIVVNLLSNALKYSPMESAVRFELICRPEELVLRVEDAGIGIPEEDRERLFEAFHRAGNVGAAPGTGLGLAIARHAVDLHGGTIDFESEVGVGTTFTVTLPCREFEKVETR